MPSLDANRDYDLTHGSAGIQNKKKEPKPGKCRLCGTPFHKGLASTIYLENGYCNAECAAGYKNLHRLGRLVLNADPVRVAREHVEMKREFETWRERRSGELDPGVEVPLSAFPFAYHLWHIMQFSLSELRNICAGISKMVTPWPEITEAEKSRKKLMTDAVSATNRGLDLIDRLYCRGGYITEIQTVYDLVCTTLKGVSRTRSSNKEDEKVLEYMRKQLAGFEETREKITEQCGGRNRGLVGEYLKAHKGRVSRKKACETVADAYNSLENSKTPIGWRVIERAVKEAGKW